MIEPEVITTVQHLQHYKQSNYVTQKKLHNAELELNNRNVTKILQNPSFLNLALVYCKAHNISAVSRNCMRQNVIFFFD